VRQLSRDLRSDLTTSHCVASLLPLEWVFGALHQCDFCFLFAAILASVSFFLSFLPFLGDRNGPAESGAATCSIPGFFLPFLGDVSVPRRAGPLPARYRRWPGVLQVRQGAGFGGGYGQQPCLGDDGILTVDIEDCRYWPSRRARPLPPRYRRWLRRPGRRLSGWPARWLRRRRWLRRSQIKAMAAVGAAATPGCVWDCNCRSFGSPSEGHSDQTELRCDFSRFRKFLTSKNPPADKKMPISRIASRHWQHHMRPTAPAQQQNVLGSSLLHDHNTVNPNAVMTTTIPTIQPLRPQHRRDEDDELPPPLEPQGALQPLR